VSGTRFKIYLPGFDTPRTVHVRARPGTIGAGPRGRGIVVIGAIADEPAGSRRSNGARTQYKQPYKDEVTGLARSRPPWTGDRHTPAKPGPGGHFDGIRAGSRAFSAAAAFATVRSVHDIWEGIFGRGLPWFFRKTYRHLEVIPRVASANSWSGEGFIECGFLRPRSYRGPMAENFDVVAHETGHLILKSVIGNPADDKKTLEYRAHEEGAADLVAFVAAMHFDDVLLRVLEETDGRLLSINTLSRIGESRRPKLKVPRVLFHTLRLASKKVRAAWRGYDKHTYALPFSAALFDVFNAIYQEHLRRVGLLTGAPPRVTPAFRETLLRSQRRLPAFDEAPEAFITAARRARDDFAHLLASAWRRTRVAPFSYPRAAAAVLAADATLYRGRHRAAIRALFRWRGIPI